MGPLSCLYFLSVCLFVCNVGVLWPHGWMDQDATWYGGRPRPRRCCMRWGPSFSSEKRHSSPPLFGQCLLWPNGCPSQQLMSSCFKSTVVWKLQDFTKSHTLKKWYHGKCKVERLLLQITNSKWYIVVVLNSAIYNDLEWPSRHSPTITSFYKCDFPYICAAAGKIVTDTERCIVSV